MISRIAVPLMATIAAASTAVADDYPRDEVYAAIEQSLRADIDRCQGEAKSVRAKFFCARDIRRRYVDQNHMRGTEGYAESTYPKLPTHQLIDAKVRLGILQRVARSESDFPTPTSRPVGELTKEDLGNELSFIDKELSKRKALRDEYQKGLLQKLQSGDKVN